MIFETTNLDLNHVQVIVQGMYAVAKCDGVHQSEMVMLREFYDNCQRDVDGLADFKDLIGRDFDPEMAKDILDTDELKDLFMSSCILLAYADGTYTPEEHTIVKQLADHIDLSDEQLGSLHEQVKDYLLRNLAKIQNLDALKEVASELTPKS